MSFDDFVARVRARLELGRVAYGDRSFDRPEDELLGELQQEALDLAGWGWVLWTRIERLRARDRSPSGPGGGGVGLRAGRAVGDCRLDAYQRRRAHRRSKR